MTKSDLNKEILRLKKENEDVRSYHKNIPGYTDMWTQLRQMEANYLKLVSWKIQQNLEWIRQYELDIKNLEKKKNGEIPEHIRIWFDKYDRGVDFGYKGIRISWISADEEFVIISNPGATAGQGTAMGTGGYYYAATSHWLAYTKGGDWHSGNKFEGVHNIGTGYKEFNGRLTNALKSELIAKIPEFIEWLKLKEKYKS